MDWWVWAIFAFVVAMLLVGIVSGLFTRSGSGIQEHPQDAGGPPGTTGGSERSGRDEGEGTTLGDRGTR